MTAPVILSVVHLSLLRNMYVCMYVCNYVCMYVCMYVCIYVSMYTVRLRNHASAGVGCQCGSPCHRLQFLAQLSYAHLAKMNVQQLSEYDKIKCKLIVHMLTTKSGAK